MSSDRNITNGLPLRITGGTSKAGLWLHDLALPIMSLMAFPVFCKRVPHTSARFFWLSGLFASY
jgi:hypothetical protein